MNNVNLHSIISDITSRKYEEEWFELKTNWYEPHILGEYISALANSAAMLGRDVAYMVWGIEDKTHKVVGTNFDYRKEVKREPLEHYLARQLSPDTVFSFQEITYEKKRLVVMTVAAASNTPTAFDHVRYLRIGSSKVNLERHPERESRLFDILRSGFPTIENTESAYQDLTFRKLFVYFESKGVSLNKRTFKKNLGFLTPKGTYNLLAQLLSDDSHVTVRFALFAGDDKTSTMYSVREFGNTCLLYSYDDVLRYGSLLNIPQADERNRDIVRKEVPLFDEGAFQEAVTNAFLHNRWLEGNAPMFTGYRNRVEVISHGTLPPGQTMEGFYAGVSVPTNEALSKIFIMLHITEHTGRGVPRITEVYGRDSIAVRDGFVTVDIPFEKINTDEEPGYHRTNTQVDTQDSTQVDTQVTTQDTRSRKLIEDTILSFCQSPKTILEIMEFLEYKERKSVRKYLTPLLEQGRIAMTVPDKPNSRLQKYITVQEQ